MELELNLLDYDAIKHEDPTLNEQVARDSSFNTISYRQPVLNYNAENANVSPQYISQQIPVYYAEYSVPYNNMPVYVSPASTMEELNSSNPEAHFKLEKNNTRDKSIYIVLLILGVICPAMCLLGFVSSRRKMVSITSKRIGIVSFVLFFIWWVIYLTGLITSTVITVRS
jgi:hypothetical protein